MTKHLKSLIALVLAAVIVASGAQAALWQWSKTASSNATADATINWSEGQSPSSVNDSARALMARVAEWRDDLSGLQETAGTSTAYTLTSNQGLSSVPNDGQAMAFTVHTTNGIAPTLRVDGGTVYPIQSAAGTAIGAGVLLSGAPYTVKFKLASTAWVLHGFYGEPFIVPVGGMIDYLGTTSPNSNFVLPVGQCISRTTYAAFFSLVGTRYGVCDGTTTFAVPDFRGTIAAAQDNMGGSARGLITTAGASCDGTVMGQQCGAQNVTLLQGNLPNVSLSGTGSGSGTGSTSGSLTTSAVNVPVGTLTGSSLFPTFETISVQAGSGQLVRQYNVGSTTQDVTFGGSLAAAAGSATGSLSVSTSVTVSSVSVALGGSGTAVNKLPPLQIVTRLLRIF